MSGSGNIFYSFKCIGVTSESRPEVHTKKEEKYGSGPPWCAFRKHKKVMKISMLSIMLCGFKKTSFRTFSLISWWRGHFSRKFVWKLSRPKMNHKISHKSVLCWHSPCLFVFGYARLMLMFMISLAPFSGNNNRSSPRSRAPLAEGVYNNSHFLHAATSQVGNNVCVQTKGGVIVEGIFKAFSPNFSVSSSLFKAIERVN